MYDVIDLLRNTVDIKAISSDVTQWRSLRASYNARCGVGRTRKGTSAGNVQLEEGKMKLLTK